MLDAGYDPLKLSMNLTQKVGGVFNVQMAIFDQETEEYFAQLKEHQFDPEVAKPSPPVPPISTAVALHKMIEAQLKLIAPSAKPIDVVNVAGTTVNIQIVNFDTDTKKPLPSPSDEVIDL
jgi:hypothetical protein